MDVETNMRMTLVLLIALAAPVALSAQELPSDLLEEWSWRSLGPRLGGRSIAAAGTAARPNEYWFGAVGGGVWKSTDGGETWRPTSDGWFESASVGSIGICEADPDVVYVGMGEGQWRGTMNTGDGAYRTRNGGESWSHVGLASETGQQVVARMRVHPEDCDRVYAAVLGDPYGPNETRGVYRTDDGGGSWERVLFRNELAGASDLILDPGDPETIYATIWDAHRPPWGGRTNGTSGIFKSTDGGDTWTELTDNPGLPEGVIGKSAIAVSAADPDRLYANIEAAPGEGGVYRSDDAGGSWRHVGTHNALFHRADYYIRIVADPTDPDVVHVLNKNWFRSADGGRTYREMRPPHGDNHDLWIDPTNPDRMIEANDGGAAVSLNGGETWTAQDYTTSQMYDAFVTADYPYLVCGAQQDGTSKCVPSDGTGGFWYQGAGGEQGYIAQHPVETTLGYGGSQRGGITRFDRETGQRQRIDVWPRQQDGRHAGEVRERFQWTFPIVTSPHDPEVVYAASQHVWRTNDRGRSWERLSPDLTRADPETLRGSEFPIKDYLSGDYYATIFTLAVSPHDPGVIWTGSDDGVAQLSRDGGGSWEEVTPDGLPEYARSALIFPSPHEPGKAYLAAHKYQLQDVRPYLFRTDDYGATWTKIVDGIPHGHYLRSVKEDPERPGLLYAGTEHGVYVSLDDGARWQDFSLDLPDTPITDVEVADDDLVISTFGRGFRLLEGAAHVLRQLDSRALAAPVHLFGPADAVRSRAGPAHGVGPELYGRARIPGANVVDVHYRLEAPARVVTVEFLDAAGEVVRSFGSESGRAPFEPVVNQVGQVVNGPGWGSASHPPAVPTDAGVHRLRWDMKTPPATDFPGMRIRGANADGPRVPPGEYTVRLTVDGKPFEEEFRVEKDPRLDDVTDADLEARFELATRVHRRFDEATSAVVELRRARERVEERIAAADDPGGVEGARALAADLREAEGALYEYRAEAESDLKHFGTELVNHLAHLKGVILSADARPTQQSYDAFDEISADLDAALARAERVLDRARTRFDEE